MQLDHPTLQSLLAVCEKATKGPWRAVALLADAENHHVLAGEFSDRHIKATTDDGNGLVAFADLPANTEFIAAFDPTTCATLIRRLLELTKEVADYEQTDLVPRSRWDATNNDWLEARQQFESLAQKATVEIGRLEAWLLEAEAEVGRLKRGEFTPEEFQDLCHNKPVQEGFDAFADGCEQYQQKLFGRCRTKGTVI